MLIRSRLVVTAGGNDVSAPELVREIADGVAGVRLEIFETAAT